MTYHRFHRLGNVDATAKIHEACAMSISDYFCISMCNYNNIQCC